MAERSAREERDDLLGRWWGMGHDDGFEGRVCRMPLRSDPEIGRVYIDGFNVGRRNRDKKAGLARRNVRV